MTFLAFPLDFLMASAASAEENHEAEAPPRVTPKAVRAVLERKVLRDCSSSWSKGFIGQRGNGLR